MTLEGVRQNTRPDRNLEGKTPEEIYKEGERLFQQGRYKQAIDVLEQSDPNNSSVQYVLGSCYLEMGKPLVALEYFSGIIEANPNRREITIVLNQCAICYMLQNGWARALGYLQKAHEINKNDIQTLTNYGICLYKMKKYDEACIFLNQAFNIEPRNHLASEYLRKIVVLKHSPIVDFSH